MCYCTVCALFYLVFQGNFQVKTPGAFIRRGGLMEGLLCYEFEGFILGGAYFSEFYGMQICVVLEALVVEVA